MKSETSLTYSIFLWRDLQHVEDHRVKALELRWALLTEGL